MLLGTPSLDIGSAGFEKYFLRKGMPQSFEATVEKALLHALAKYTTAEAWDLKQPSF